MNLYLDIETIPTDWQAAIDYITASAADDLTAALAEVKAPGNYKDPAKIAEYIAAKQDELKSEFVAAVADKVRRTSLDGAFGRVCVIGWALDDHAVNFVKSADNEARVLHGFADCLRDNIAINEVFDTCVIGHNVSSFDLRFLTQRFIVHGIRPPHVISRAAQAKPWEQDKVFDTMVQWSGVGQRVSLDKLCVALEIPSPKGDITGATVAAAVAAGRIDDVAAYCVKDVEAVRAVHRRMTFADLGKLALAA